MSAGSPSSDPRVLRGIAHPLRGRILEEVYATGSMRAADVAEALGIPANQASFHLRQLAKYGLVEPDPGAARDKRDRVWRPTSDAALRLDLKELEEAPGGRAAVALWARAGEARAHEVVREAFSLRRRKGTVTTITDSSLRLTKAEADELSAELDDVLSRWTKRTRGSRADGARTYLFFSALQPFPEQLQHGAD